MRAFVLLVLTALTLTGVAQARSLEELRAKGTLVWAADQEGGAPFVYPANVEREDAPADSITGFEVELVERPAQRLGVRAEFAQAQWSTLPEMVRLGKADLVVNGVERTAALARSFALSKPYYLYSLRLLRRRGEGPASWAELGSGTRVGVLLGSAAEREVRARAPLALIDSFDGNTDAMTAVKGGRLDATVQDSPIVAYYAKAFPTLEVVDEPVGHGGYVALAQQGDEPLIEAFDATVREALHSGELERLYRRYQIWDEQQAKLAEAAALPPESAPPLRGWRVLQRFAVPLLQSAGLTVLLSLCAFPLALGLGLLVALGRTYGPRWLRALLAAYVEAVRGTPLLLQLYFLFFVLPELGLTLSAFPTAVLGLALNYSAYEAEIQRAGLAAVPREQTEAALALGMSRTQAWRHVVLPQAARVVLPPSVNDFIALFKDTSVCSAITLVELTKRYSVLALSTQATLELMAITATLYLMMSLPLALLARRLERHLQVDAEAGR